MKHRFYIGLIAFLAFQVSCSNDDSSESMVETNFTSFSIEGIEGETTISPEQKKVTVRLPMTVTNGDTMTPIFTVSEGMQASINRVVQKSGEGKMNFNNMVLYTVSDANYSVKSRWRVTVTNNDYTADYGMGNFLTYWWSNNGRDPNGFYLQQQHTGPYANVNCGPACAAMALKWYAPDSKGGVEDARNYAVVSEIDGGVSWYPRDIFNYLYNSGVTGVYYWNFDGATYDGFVSTICSLLEKGNLCIVCLNNSNISEQTVTNKEYRTGRYYPGGLGHFLVVKGYRVVNGVTWFEVNDPWGLDLKYSDGTYYGENRYYLGREVATCIDWNIWTVVVPPSGNQSKAFGAPKFVHAKRHSPLVQGQPSTRGGGDDKQSHR